MVVLPHPRRHLAELRGIIASPEDHDEAVVLDACEDLFRLGSEHDHARARRLHRKISMRGVARLNRRGRILVAVSIAVSAFILIIAVIALCLAGFELSAHVKGAV